jgi:hypothetical protein
MHYHRKYRHGSVNAVATGSGISASQGRRYLSVYAPGHPISSRNGKAYVHRVVLFDAIGPGRHACHWCGKSVTWDSTRGDADCLAVDHLNGVGDDNRLANLVPCCWGCNTARGQQARARALREAGWWSGHDTISHLRTGGRRPAVESIRPVGTVQLALFE